MKSVWVCRTYSINGLADYCVYGNRDTAYTGWKDIVDELKQEFQCTDKDMETYDVGWQMYAGVGDAFWVECTETKVIE